MVLCIAEVENLGVPINKSVEAISNGHLASSSRARSMVNAYVSTSIIHSTDNSNRGKGNPNHPLHQQPPNTNTIQYIETQLDMCRQGTAYHTLTTLSTSLFIDLGVEVSKCQLRRWLIEQGYSFEKKKYVSSISPALKQATIRSFIFALAKATKEERMGKRVLVFMDESYIHPGHSPSKIWCKINSLAGQDVQGSETGGKRVLILHAMSRFGLLADPSCDGANNNLTEEFPTAEVVFEELGVHNGDYHNCFDGEKFISWLTFRLIPAFRKLFPRKRMTLVMDNAPYHSPPGLKTFQPSKMNAPECVSFFADRKIKTVDVPRDAGFNRIPMKMFSKGANAGGPTVSEKKAAVSHYLRENPGTSTTQTEDVMNNSGYDILWTPPYTPSLQPIELLWAKVKGEVARQWRSGRTIKQCREQVESAFERVSPEVCSSLVGHVHRWISEWMKKDEDGRLHAFEDFNDLVQHPPRESSPPVPMDIDDSG
jgi:DDE superfamily endonuclease